MILACKRCKFLFERTRETEICPNCNRDTVTYADPEEEKRYLQEHLPQGKENEGNEEMEEG